MTFPISRDPPEGGTSRQPACQGMPTRCFQFLGIPPKGELLRKFQSGQKVCVEFPISRDPPEGGTFTVEYSQISSAAL